jgi:hypothetical protein
MIIVVSKGGIRELEDPIIWTNIAYALKVEEKRGFTKTCTEGIVGWKQANYSTIRPNEHIWICGHGEPGYFCDGDMLGEDDKFNPLFDSTKGLKKEIKISGITMLSCCGAEDGQLKNEIFYSNLVKLHTKLSQNGLSGINLTAYIGGVVAAPTQNGDLIPCKSIRNDRSAIAEDLQIECGWKNTESEAKKYIRTYAWKAMNNVQRAEKMANITRSFYTKWVEQCAVNGLFQETGFSSKSLTSHDWTQRSYWVKKHKKPEKKQDKVGSP